jgi:hypothetical protein
MAFFTGGTDLAGLGEELSKFATKAMTFFMLVATFPKAAFTNASKLFKSLADISNIPNAGGFAQFWSGENDFEGTAKGLNQLAGAKKFFTVCGDLKPIAFTNASKLFDVIKDCSDKGIAYVSLDGLEEKGTALTNFMNKAKGFFTSAEGINTQAVNNVTIAIQKFTSAISKITTTALPNLNAGVSSAFSSMITVVTQAIDTIASKVSTLPNKMGEGIRGSGSALSDAFVAIWKDAVIATSKPVNKLISGANWVLKELGATKRLVSWTPYAKGTHGHRGGNALVNDGRGAELIQMPNGKTFLPQGKNVFIPNAPKGMKVLPAEETARLLGRSSPTYKYAKGTGNFDVYDYYDNPAGLVDRVKSTFVSYKGLSGLKYTLGKSMVDLISTHMVPWAKKMLEEYGEGKYWKWPSTCRIINSRYGPRTRPTKGASTNHGGIDIGASFGTPVLASKGGKVTIAGWSGGYGNLVEIAHRNGWSSRYGHNSALLVSPGQRVRQGQPIALVGSTGVSTGPHIHFEIRHNGGTLNPLSFLGQGFANGGIATKPSIFGEAGAEMAIPLSRDKRDRALDLWAQTGDMLGLSSYTPASDANRSQVNAVENNNYSPVFNFYISGGGDTRATARAVKQAAKEALREMLESMDRRTPSLQVY